MPKDKLIHDLADILSQVSAEKKWLEQLEPEFARYYERVKRVLGELDQMMKDGDSIRFAKDDLQIILGTWESAASVGIPIAMVSLEPCARYVEFGGICFRTLDDLRKAIAEYDPEKTLYKSLATEMHKITITL